VLNWSISRDHKEILNSTKLSATSMMYVTRGDSVQRPLTSGPRRWPTDQIPWPVGQILSRFGPKLLRHMSKREGKGYGGGESW
jgi:hypothetical protein